MQLDPKFLVVAPDVGVRIHRWQPITSDEIRARSCGPVTAPRNYDAQTETPVIGGMFCPVIFGPIECIPTTRDPRRDRWGHIEFAEELPHPCGREGTLSAFPVLPPYHRPLVKMADGRYAVSDLTDHYRRLVSKTMTLRRVLEIGAPAAAVSFARAGVTEAFEQLLQNEQLPSPIKDADGRVLTSLRSYLAGQRGPRTAVDVAAILFALGIEAELAPG